MERSRVLRHERRGIPGPFVKIRLCSFKDEPRPEGVVLVDLRKR